jgi:hypothetical protein
VDRPADRCGQLPGEYERQKFVSPEEIIKLPSQLTERSIGSAASASGAGRSGWHCRSWPGVRARPLATETR